MPEIGIYFTVVYFVPVLVTIVAADMVCMLTDYCCFVSSCCGWCNGLFWLRSAVISVLRSICRIGLVAFSYCRYVAWLVGCGSY